MNWEQLVTDHHAHVYRIALGIVRDRAAAEDVTQDVYLDLLRRPGSLDRADDPAAFLGRCAVNRALKAVRGGDRRQRHETAAPARGGQMDPVEEAFRREIREKVAELPEEHRVVVSLHYFSGMAVSEVAKVLDVPQGTAASRLSAALGKLRKALAAAAFGGLLASLERHLEACAVDGPDAGLGRRLLDLPESGLAVPARSGAGRVALVAAVAVVGLALFVVAPRLYKSWEQERRRAEQEAAVASFVPEAVLKHREDWKAAEQALSPSARVRLDQADRETEVHGLVVRDDMTPVAGAVLRTMLRPWGDLVPARLSEGEEEPGPSTTSADDGTFALKLAPGSEARLHVSASGYPAFFLPEVHAGERLLVVVPRGSRIEVLARDRGGVPMPGVRFRAAAAREDMDLAAELSGVTDAEGLCVLEFPGGCWAMLVADRGDVGAARERIWLEPGGVARREIVVQGGRDIDGRVVDAETGLPISSASVNLGASALRHATTDSEGRFHISAWTDEGIPAPEVFVTSAGYASVRLVPPAAGPVEIRLSRGVSLSGRAVDSAGLPVAGARVVAEVDGYRDGSSFARAVAGPDGRFRLTGLRTSDPHLVQLAASGYGRVFHHVGASAGPTVELGDLTLPPARTVQGRALSANGSPLPRARVSLNAKWETRQYVDQGLTGPMRLPPGRDVLTDDLGRFVFEETAPGVYEISMASKGLAAVEREIEVPADRDVTVDLSPPQSRRVTVVLTEEDGSPVPDFEFLVIDVKGFELVTDSDGRASFPSNRKTPTIDLAARSLSGSGPAYIWERSGDWLSLSVDSSKSEVRITGVRAATVKGRATFESAPESWERRIGVRVGAEDWGRCSISDDGTFEAFIPEGRTADLVVGPVGNGAEMQEGRLTGLKGGESGLSLEVRRVPRDGRMRVRVLDGSTPAVGAAVVLEGPCGEVARATADSEGIVDFEHLPCVPLRAVAEAESALAAVRLPGVKSGLAADGREVTLVLTPSVNVTGVATDAEGRPVEQTTVCVEVDGETAVRVPADASGRFVVRASADPGRKQLLRATCEYPWREGTAVPGGAEVRIVMEEPK